MDAKNSCSRKVRVIADAPYWQNEEGYFFGFDDKDRIQIQKRTTDRKPVVNFYVEKKFVEFL